MEVIFPTAAGYAGFFMVGFRKTANGVTQRTGTVILKRTYAVDPVAETLMPSAAALPVFMQDQADNLVSNSDFELGEVNSPSDWEPEAATIALATGQGVASSKALQVSGSANGLLRNHWVAVNSHSAFPPGLITFLHGSRTCSWKPEAVPRFA